MNNNSNELHAKFVELQNQKQTETANFAAYEQANAEIAAQHKGLNMKALDKQIKWLEPKLKQKFYAIYDGENLLATIALAGASFRNTPDENDVLHVHVRAVTDTELRDDEFALSSLRASMFSNGQCTAKPITQQDYEQAVIKAVKAFHEPANDGTFEASKKFVTVFKEHRYRMSEIDKQLSAINATVHTMPYSDLDSLLSFLASL